MRKIFQWALVLAATLASPGLGQNSNEAIVISQDFVIEGRVVKGVPYTANSETTVKQTLPTGSEITTQMKALVARDAEGRTRREQTLGAIGPWALWAPPMGPGETSRLREDAERMGNTAVVILIQDPVKHVNYLLEPNTHIVRESHPRTPEELQAARERENRAQAGREPRSEPRPEPRREEIKRTENLGSRVIEGVPARGTRTITTLATGSIGNSAPIELVVETWYSPELQVVVLGKRSDPRVGDITYRLVNVKRGDPPASLFEVPPDYHPPQERGRPFNEREVRK